MDKHANILKIASLIRDGLDLEEPSGFCRIFLSTSNMWFCQETMIINSSACIQRFVSNRLVRARCFPSEAQQYIDFRRIERELGGFRLQPSSLASVFDIGWGIEVIVGESFGYIRMAYWSLTYA